MALALIRPGQLYAWKGPSLLLVDTRGECGEAEQLSGYYFREARFLRTLRLEINGRAPWPCEAGLLETHALAFTSIYPELTEFGGGGSGQSGDDVSTDEVGIPHRALSLRATYALSIAGLTVSLTISNHSTRHVDADVAWVLDADFADIQEAHEGKLDQRGDLRRQTSGDGLTFTYQHPQLKYRTAVAPIGATPWTVTDSTIKTRVRLEPQEAVVLGFRVDASDANGEAAFDDAEARELHLRTWQERLTRVAIPPNRLAERILQTNVRDFASFPLLEGPPDEWLTLQAGMPLYPALFGRDTLTAGWQAAYLDRGESLDASLTRLGRMQSDRVYDWRDEEPGRIPYQVRRGPLALLDVNPYSRVLRRLRQPLDVRDLARAPVPGRETRARSNDIGMWCAAFSSGLARMATRTATGTSNTTRDRRRAPRTRAGKTAAMPSYMTTARRCRRRSGPANCRRIGSRRNS